MQPSQKEGKLISISFRVRYLHKLFGILHGDLPILFIYLFIYSAIYLYQYGLVGLYLR